MAPLSRPPVPAPLVTAPRAGLLVSAAEVSDEGVRWGTGVEYSPEACTGLTGAVALDCPTELPDVDPTVEGKIGFDAFQVWGVDRCSAMTSVQARDGQGRARRALVADQSHHVAAELWGGALTTGRHASPEDRSPYLTDGDSQDLGAIEGATRAIVTAEATFLRCSRGRRAMVHLTPYAFGLALEEGGAGLLRDGNLWVTAQGSIIVADSGYGATALDLEVHVTSLVSYRLGPIGPADEPTGVDAPGPGMDPVYDHAVNTFTWWAKRPALYQLDADCCRVSATIDLP